MPIQSIILSPVYLGNVVLLYMSDVVLVDHNWIFVLGNTDMEQLDGCRNGLVAFICMFSLQNDTCITMALHCINLLCKYLSIYYAEVDTILN